MQSSFTHRQVNRRFQGLLGALKTGNVRPNAEIVHELAELTQALDDAPARPDVIARLTLHRADSTRIIVEVHADATFTSFYHIFAQQGNRRSTKRRVRTAGRNEGMNLEAIAIAWKMRESPNNPVTDINIRLIRRRVYRRLVGARPDELGLTQCRSRLPVLSPARS
jgi:hypothetical protein